MACTKNPILDYIDMILSNHIDEPRKTFTEIINEIDVRQMQNPDEYCCADCGSISYVGQMFDKNNESWLFNIKERVGTYLSTGCCENYDVNNIRPVITQKIVEKSNDPYLSKVCCNSFNDCSAAFNNMMQQYVCSTPGTALFNPYVQGIHEFNTFNGDTILCAINAKIQTLNAADRSGFLDAIYNLGGFVSFCVEGQVFVGNASNFITWW